MTKKLPKTKDKRTEAEKREQSLRDRAAIRGISVEDYKRELSEFNKSKGA